MILITDGRQPVTSSEDTPRRRTLARLQGTLPASGELLWWGLFQSGDELRQVTQALPEGTVLLVLDERFRPCGAPPMDAGAPLRLDRPGLHYLALRGRAATHVEVVVEHVPAADNARAFRPAGNSGRRPRREVA